MTQPDRPSLLPIFISCALLSLIIIGAAIWRTTGTYGIPFLKKTSPDSALSMPENGDPDMRLHLPSPWNTIGIPKAIRFDFPAGSENGALLKIDGIDFTGIGSTNTSLGDPVFAVADGKVVYAGRPAPDSENVVLISHVMPDGKTTVSCYDSLHATSVVTGSLVARGAMIGVMGISTGADNAGLIFEWQNSNGVKLEGAPAEVLKKLRTAPAEALAPSPLSKM